MSGKGIGIVLGAGLCFATTASTVHAFGTIDFFGQHGEHRKITRAALAGAGFGPQTLEVLAGRRGSFGAVGAADRPDRGLLNHRPAHCDGGDHLDIAGYPQTGKDARDWLTACRGWIVGHLDAAVLAAGDLTEENLAIRPQATLDRDRCRFVATPARGKCAVLAEPGLAFHAAQDFYAHSNWVDAPVSGEPRPSSPPGLGRTGRADWLDPRVEQPFPSGLISGCYNGFPEFLHCHWGWTAVRVKHAFLNKDEGAIDDLGQAGAGTTQRGRVDHNFAHAVAAAIDDTQDKWAFFEQRVRTVYGDQRGARIVCLVEQDDPQTCAARA